MPLFVQAVSLGVDIICATGGACCRQRRFSFRARCTDRFLIVGLDVSCGYVLCGSRRNESAKVTETTPTARFE